MKTLTEDDIAPFVSAANLAVYKKNAELRDFGLEGRSFYVMLCNDLIRAFGGVSELDARERERAAYMSAVDDARPYLSSPPSPAKRLDALYPSLIPKPRTVTLSDGKMWAYESEGVWKGFWRWGNAMEGGIAKSPICANADDMEKCLVVMREIEKCR